MQFPCTSLCIKASAKLLNVIGTCCAPCVSQDVNEHFSLRYPSLYRPGQLNLLFNKRKFFTCTLHGVFTSFVLFFVPYVLCFSAVRDDGAHVSDQQAFAITIATSLVIVVSVQVRPFTGSRSELSREKTDKQTKQTLRL